MQQLNDISQIKVIQAPLAGISDYVFRKLIRKHGSKCLLTSEMLSAEALNNNPNPKDPILKFDEEQYPLSFQLVGHKPAMMAKCAKILENKASTIDLNFGCPVNKVVKGQDGCAMMKTPKLAHEIVCAIKDIINIPLSAKFRLGWAKESENFIEFALMLQDAGVDFVTLHARTRSQMYGEKADWEKIAQLKKELKIPLFANGDIKTLDDAINCLEITGAQGASIGRGIMGDFTLPYRIEHYFKTGTKLPEPPLSDKIKMLKEHLAGEIELRGAINGIKFMRKFYGFYIAGIQNASKYRQILVTLENLEEIERVLDDILCLSPANRT
jgi:nifR3 family TIM-barrel protein